MMLGMRRARKREHSGCWRALALCPCSPDGFLLPWLPANGVAEAHLLAVMSARVMREQCRLQVCLEGCGVGTQDTLRTKRGGIQVADDRVDGPVMRFDKGVAGHICKACFSQYPLVMVGAAARLWLRGNGAVCGSAARPAADDLRDQALPRFRAARDAIA